jgi:hypothetical protein
MKGVCLTMLLGTVGCATIYRGERDDVWFISNPPGATVTIDGYEEGTTPCMLVFKRGSRTKTVLFQLKGYEPCQEQVSPAFSGGLFAFEFILNSILFSLIDLGTGNLWEWPYGVEAKLVPKGEGTSLISCKWPMPTDPQPVRASAHPARDPPSSVEEWRDRYSRRSPDPGVTPFE